MNNERKKKKEMKREDRIKNNIDSTHAPTTQDTY